MTSVNKGGLEDVVALQSKICFIDGQKRQLVYRGYDIGELIGKTTFEEVVYLLWNGCLPPTDELRRFREQLTQESTLPDQIIALLRSCPTDAEPMTVLRTAVSALGLFDPDAGAQDLAAYERIATRLMAKTPIIVAYWGRLREGKEPIPPKPGLGLAANFLYMLSGREPEPMEEEIFDAALILHADHELNASTFAARVAMSTLTDMYSAVTAAIGTLKGPLHGGANEQVMRMLVAIGDVANVDDWLRAALERKERIMGFGHRVYRTGDPRADYLREFSRRLGERRGELKWHEISRRLEERMLEAKGLYPNVDFYSASTYYMLGIPMELYTPIFAFSRMSGWTAHLLEQFTDNRLIRPRAEYVGPRDLRFVPMAERVEQPAS